MAQVHLRGVKKTYDNKLEVIHGIDMEIADGEFIVIVGPSGCGKSTLLRMVAGLERITGGEVAIGDRVVNELEPKDRDIAMVFQNYALYPHMSVYDNMAYGLKIRGMPKDEIERRVQQGGQDPRARDAPGAQAAPAFGRPAPARRDGPRHRARARGVPVRRAALQPRRQAPRADAARDQAPAARAGRHLDLRDARPGRGDDPGRPADRHERRRRRPDRHADGRLRPAGLGVRGGLHRLAGDELPGGQGRTGRQVGRSRRHRHAMRVSLPLGAADLGAGRHGGGAGHPARAPASRRRRAARSSRSSWPSRWAPTPCCTAASARRASW